MNVPFNAGAGSPPVPDVDALVQRVRAGVAGRLGRGEYARADLDALRRIEFESRERTDFGPTPAADLVRLHASWDPLGPHTFTSHRGGIGALIVAGKQLLRRLVRPVAAVSLAPQAQFNAAVARLLTGAAHGVQSLETDSETIARRVYDLECRSRELNARCDELQAEVNRLRARLDPGGRPGGPG